MKPLTIEQLKALEIGDWIWVVRKDIRKGMYVQICYREKGVIFEGKNYAVLPNFTTYGKDWEAYKNKEQTMRHVYSVTIRNEEIYKIAQRNTFQEIYDFLKEEGEDSAAEALSWKAFKDGIEIEENEEDGE